MALQPQYIELPMTGGLDEKANKEGTVEGFLQLDNLEYTDDSDSIRPRHGFVRTEAFTTNNEHGFIVSGDAFTRVSGGFKSRTLGTTWNGRRVRSTDSAVSPTQILIVVEEYLETETTNWSSAYPNLQVSWALRDRTTWALITSGGSAGSGSGAFLPRVALDVDGTTFNIFWCEGTLGSAVSLKCTKVSVGGGASGLTIDTNVQSEVRTVSGSPYDAITNASATVIAWNSAAGNIKLANFTAAGGVSATFNDTTSTTGAACSVAVACTSSVVVVLYHDNADGQASVYPLSIASRTRGTKGGTPVFTHASQLLRSFTLCNSTGTLFSCACSADGGMMTSVYDSSNDAVSSTVQYRGMVPTTKMFNASLVGVQYFDTSTGTASFPSVLVVDISSGNLKAQFAFDEDGMLHGGGARSTPSLSSVVGSEPFTVTVAVTEETADANSAGVPVCRARTVELSQATDVFPTAQLCGVGFMGGSVPRIWDGSSLIPAAAPAVAIAPILSSTGTGLTGTYAYCVVVEYTDARGNFQVSPPSAVSSITVSDKTITVGVVLPVTLFGTTVRTKVYRTTNGGSTFYLDRAFVQSAASVTVNDAVTDVALSTYEILYTTAELASEIGPPLTALVTHRNRLFGIRADNPRTIAYTQETTDPTLPRWNAVLTLEVDNTAGDPVALASLDDKVLIFQRDQVVAVNGFGPDASGSNGSFSLPEKVADGVGVDAANRRSVCAFPNGVMFRHRSGVFVIGRDLSVNPVGLSIQRTLGSATVWASRFLPSRHQIWLLLDPSTYTGGGACPILVYDVRYGRWSTFSMPFTNIRDVVEVAGTVYVLEATVTNGVSGRVFKLDTSSFVDKLDGVTPTYVASTIQPPWLRGAGRNGTQRLWGLSLHGQLVSGSGVGVTVDAYTQKGSELAKNPETSDNHYAFDTSLLGSLPAGGFSLPLRVVTQRCSAFRVKVTITPTITDAESLRLTALTLSYGVEPGKGKAPLGRKPSAS